MVASGAVATTSPRDRGPLPQSMQRRMAVDPSAYQMTRAWIQRVQSIKQTREAASAPERLSGVAAVSGTINVPVLAGYFLSETEPYSSSNLQDKLFDNPAGTVTDFWDEVSYGNLNLTGTVYGWTQVTNNGSYYAGPNNGSEPLTDRVGQFIKELLDVQDGAVDFGEFDNDGPDGVPNSGDDDGFVDFVAVVHSRVGAECGGNPNIWSHRWVYSAWNVSGGLPYATNDTSATPGIDFVRVNDYSINPAWNCDGTTVIDIGVFCHEFGHALGLPDLYDTTENSSGIGDWGIMGSGNWNSTDSPAHPCAWTRAELGWVTPAVVSWDTGVQNIPDINSTPVAFKLPFSSNRFQRSSDCAINGSYSLFCGLSASEAVSRGWSAAGPGYGSSWNETVSREFNYDGSGSVSFSYDFAYSLEPGYDSAFAVIDVQGTESILASYTGTSSGAENFDITTFLSPLASGDPYTLKFRVITDRSFADDDSGFVSTCGALAVDDVAVSGGGESYAADFETYSDGWFQDPDENPDLEYWLVENRVATGFDQHLYSPGLLIFHVDERIMQSAGQGNSGGQSGVLAHGLSLEQADGFAHLDDATNRGDTGDPYPGASDNRNFSGATIPGSSSNSGHPTIIGITGISDVGSPMSATLTAGEFAPVVTTVAPDTIDNDQSSVSFSITGSNIKPGATFRLAYSGGSPSADTSAVVPASTRWVDEVLLSGTMSVYSKSGGLWDVIVTNPDGQSVTLPGAVTINYLVAARLQTARLDARGDGVFFYFELLEVERDETIRLLRSGDGGQSWTTLVAGFESNDLGYHEYVDNSVVPGKMYEYLLEVVDETGVARVLHRGSVTVPARDMILHQNYPNPFNPTTNISYYLPEAGDVFLGVYDVSGALVKTVVRGYHSVGEHEASWDGRDQSGQPVASGVYLYQLKSGKATLMRKMVLLK